MTIPRLVLILLLIGLLLTTPDLSIGWRLVIGVGLLLLDTWVQTLADALKERRYR